MAQADILRAIMDAEFRAQFLRDSNLSEEDLAGILENAAKESSPHFNVI